MHTNPLRQLPVLGQSVWFDNIQRSLLTSGRLAAMIAADDLRGITSNPTIFAQAITNSSDYDEDIAALARKGRSPAAIFETLAIEDIQAAADIFRPVYEHSQGRDGYVSLEVSPLLAQDTAGTIAEAERLWRQLARPNVMIKIPATPQGLAAVTPLTAAGININVTLIFSRRVYEQAAAAYIAGLEQRAAAGQPLAEVRSVASVFVSRIDSAVDALLARQNQKDAAVLRGRIAIANAKLIYQQYQYLCQSPRFQALAARGAAAQRPLWASTSTKNPAYSDVLYVEELIGPDTVTTLPPATLDAFRHHGRVALTLTQGLEEAARALDHLAALGIDLEAVCHSLLTAGVKAFRDSFTALLDAIAAKTA